MIINHKEVPDNEIIEAAKTVCLSEYPDDYNQIVDMFKEMIKLLRL